MSFQMMETTEEQAPEILKTQDEQGVAALQFTKVDDYTTFRAEFAVVDDDLVFHFFLPPELEGVMKDGASGPTIADRVKRYWMDSFPRTLDHIARDFFKAEFPQLKAAFTADHDLHSWWLRGYGMAAVMDPAARAKLFIAKLDQALDAVNINVRPA